MATSRIRTLNFLPEIFKTTTNSQFLKATLDQITDQPNLEKIEGYIGSKFGNGINAKSNYVIEPTKVRTDYQLDPGVVFLKKDTSVAQDFISYPGILDALKLEGGVTDNNDRLFTSQFYSWDSFTDLDKIINFNQYYWLPQGPDQVEISSATVFSKEDYAVVDTPNGYNIFTLGNPDSVTNPTLTLLRGGTYTFTVAQASKFWIQGSPGVSGTDPLQKNIPTRNILGVENNGAEVGVVTFTVPFKTAQSEYIFPGNNLVDLVSTIPYDQINGALVNSLSTGIDGITSFEGLTVMFYNTGVPSEQGFISSFYDTTTYDQIDPALVDGFGAYEGGYYTDVSATFYTITYVIDPTDPTASPTIKLVEASAIPSSEKITAQFGTEWITREFYRDLTGTINLIPYNSAILDVLYYQDGSAENKVGQLRLINSNITNTTNILEDILGKKQYTATNGVVFTNGLKVVFSGDVYPTSYLTGQYYVEGVGTAIELIPVQFMIAPEKFTSSTYNPFDVTSYDIANYDSTLYIPVTPDYITIARNALNRNAWTRSNRWFHVDVINATAVYNNTPSSVSVYATAANKAKRPIVEFYPNLKMFDSGIVGKQPIDFFDFRATDAFTEVAGKINYYPDVISYSTPVATIAPITGSIAVTVTATDAASSKLTCSSTSGFHLNDQITFTAPVFGNILASTYLPPNPVQNVYYISTIESTTEFTVSTSISGPTFLLSTASGTMLGSLVPYSTFISIEAKTLNVVNITGPIAVGQFITDTTNVLPKNSKVSAISGTSTLLITVTWTGVHTVAAATNSSFVTTNTTVDNYNVFDGARIVFAADTNARNKIYVVHFSSIGSASVPVITLTEADDGLVLVDEQTVAYRGYNYQSKEFYFTESGWIEGQQKTQINQAPLFDIFDNNGISFSNATYYSGSSFSGNKLFAYGIGTGTNDAQLGFPLKYSSVNNVGDISFDVSLNVDSFSYVEESTPKTQRVNTGYVHSYSNIDTNSRSIGWQTAVAPSTQYQIFEFSYDALAPTTVFTCDIAMMATNSWPTSQVYVNNVLQATDTYAIATTTDTTVVTLSVPNPLINTVIQILLLSDQVSKTAYYGVPANLNNNPLNDDLTTVNVGELRGQYQSIFLNAPGMTGPVFGDNNYHDSGNLVQYGNKLIQNSASLVLPGAFLRKQNYNLFNALLFNSREYVTFKTLLVDTINSKEYSVYQTPASILDDALDSITATKTDSNSFFWSDMLPSKAAYISNTYTFTNSLDTSVYPVSKIYNFTTSNYDGVLVYLTRTTSGLTQTTQLVMDVDYVVSSTSPSLTITLDLLKGDSILINEYKQTYGSYVPNTPTKLGLYPATIPSVTLDSAYVQPTYFIVGHDGSFNRLYGDYDPITGKLIDFRDQALLEFELRIYNNLKISAIIPVQSYEVLPGFFRDTGYSNAEFLEIYSTSFLNWVGQNRVDYKKQIYSSGNEFTYNYSNSGNKLNGDPIEQGNWRGVYQYFYDTTQPDVAPWEMLGFANKPTWWETRYGVAPYTSDNMVLWNDLAQGIDWNNGTPIVIKAAIRPQLLEVLPVDSAGNLVSPFVSIVGNYDGKTFNKDWKVGDEGPTEFSYRRSSSWPFDLMRILALTKPAEFFNLAVDVDNYKYNTEFNQYLVNDRSHLVISDIEIYGSGIPKTSYINWIVDFEKQVGIDSTQNIVDLFSNLDVRLVYRLAGFSDKNLLKFYVEKGTPNSNNSSLLIPDESYAVLLYDNQPFNTIIYSGVIVQITTRGYKVYGNSQVNAYFTALKPIINGNYNTVEVENVSVQIANNYEDTTVSIPYGTEFSTIQEVSQFLMSYGSYLESQGVVFDQIESGLAISWGQMVAELLYWSQVGWEIGSIANINPAAKLLTIDKDSNIVQPLTLRQKNFVLNQNLYPIQAADLSVVRDGTLFSARPLADGDTISYGTFNVSNFEHGIVFDNTTIFNDVIYSLVTGLRQNRIIVRGTKTAEWNGTIDAQGFILNQDNIAEWSVNAKYTTGSIVTYKNKYWIALKIVQAKLLFDETEWKVSAYNEIQKGLLPNASTRSYESSLYYDVNKANLERDADLLSYSLIGYRPRDYMATADLTDITQVNVYKNMIKSKGTLNAASAFKGATLAQGGIDYEIYENWAIKTGEFGGVLNSNFAEFRLNESLLTGNPSIVGLTNSIERPAVQQEVPLYTLFNYSRPITAPNILPVVATATPSSVFPDAGYANFNDVKASSFYYSGLPTAVDASGVVVPLSELYVRDYVWIANYQGTWQIYTPSSLSEVTTVKNNLNGTVTLTFAKEHNLSKYQPLAVVNFSSTIDGYYTTVAIVDLFNIIVSLDLSPAITTIVGQGIGFKFQSQRVETSRDIANLPLLDSEFIKNKVWVDTNTNGDWSVLRKSINYQFGEAIDHPLSSSFGSAVAFTSTLGYLISDAAKGEVYRYTYNQITETYDLAQTITNAISFGSVIAHAGNTFIISEPTSATPVIRIYELVVNQLVNNLEYLVGFDIDAPSGVTNWGSTLALSDDTVWLYVSDINNNSVYAYRKSAITSKYELAHVIDADALGLTTSGDKFGHAITTDYYGDVVTITAPNKDFDMVTDNWGYAYVFNRTVQNIEAQYTSLEYVPQIFTLATVPSTVVTTASATTVTTNLVTCVSTSGFVLNDPIVFSGAVFSNSGLSANTVYYIKSIVSNTFSVSLTRGGTVVALTSQSGTMTVTAQTVPLFVSVNGTIIGDSNYSIVNNLFNVIKSLTAGDIVTVGSANFVLAQTLTTQVTPRVGVQFGHSVDTTSFSSEILVGAPFELGTQNHEGAVYRFTNGGGKYGMLIGTSACVITSPVTILLNGYAVTLPIGNAASAALAINSAHITNVQASSADNKLIISLISSALATPSNKLSLSVLDTNTPSMIGISMFTQTQIIECPHLQSTSQFGSSLKFNEFTSFVASAPSGTRFSATTFDFTDDETDNDTVFDNNATQWVDDFVNAGAVYMFDYLPTYNENLTNPGIFVYAQSVNAIDALYGAQPMYGTALEFNNSTVVIGTPNFRLTYINGQVVTYSSTASDQDWAIYRSSSEVVDINRIQDIQLFSALTNTTLDHLDYIDPLQGKILGVARENIDIISNVDPAGYNSPDTSTTGTRVWGEAQVGQLWFNTTSTRFVNYHQNDISYNSQYWGTVFPGSDVAVYSWVSSNTVPALYTGPGTVFDSSSYATEYIVDASDLLSPMYFFWVRNTNIIFTKTGKTLSDKAVQSYIASPQTTGISYFTPLLPSAFGLYNSYEYINANDTVLHIGFSTGTNGDPAHSSFSLIRDGYASDFLPGLPGSGGVTFPESLYDRLLDSLSGADEAGDIVPNPYLPKAVQYGIQARPRQSFFINRFNALNNYLTFANEILAQYPINETRRPSLLSANNQFYDTRNYWNYVNWWAVGYNDSTKASAQVAIYADLATLVVPISTVILVSANSDGNSETYVFNATSQWERVGLTNGTIQFSSYLWDYEAARLGFGDNFFSTTPYDYYPSEETRFVVRALNEEIFTNDLLIYRNKGLILLFEFIQSETIESQNYLPWLNKTSFIDVAHTIRELVPVPVYQADNQEFLSGYMNEVKPYHVVIKEFLFKYTGIDVYSGNVSDFDLPAQYNSSVEQFITPELVYASPDRDNQYLPSDPIWNDPAYTQWKQNHGLQIAGVLDYPISVLSTYISLNSRAFAVDNAYGFPVNGIVMIDSEMIGYSSVDLLTSTLSGLTRGVNGTTIAAHLPGKVLYTDLPAVLLFDAGRGYVEQPKVTAYIDLSIYPAPTREAVLTAVMNLDSILRIDVIDPGQGYSVLPSIQIAPSIVATFNSTFVSTYTNTIELPFAVLKTGDLVVYSAGADTTVIGGLVDNQYYYVNVLDTNPTFIVALYTNYSDAIRDADRVILTSTGTGANNTLSVSARASCVTSAAPIRENKLALRFDRIAYNSRLTDWNPGNFYGSFYAGDYSNSTTVASSSILLDASQPPINSILASAQGATFEIEAVSSEVSLVWSSRTREVTKTHNTGNTIEIQPSVGGTPVSEFKDIGSTSGFYIGMPVKFDGAVVGNLLANTTYYVKSLVDLLDPVLYVMAPIGFTVSDTITDGIPGSVVVLSSAAVGSSGMTCYTGSVLDIAVVTLDYPGISLVTNTTSVSNSITVPLTLSGHGGTQGLYVGHPIFFTGPVFGGILVNEPYYVTTVTSSQTFTLSKKSSPIIIDVTNTTSGTNVVTCAGTLNLSVNDPIIFTGITFGNIVDGQLYYVNSILDNTTFTIASILNSVDVTLTTDSGTCVVTDQKDTFSLKNASGSMTLNVGLPVSPGQINGQKFTFYPTSTQYANRTGTVGNLLTRTVKNALALGDFFAISSDSNGIENIYEGISLTVQTAFGGLLAATPYVVSEFGIVSATVTSTSSSGNEATCTSTDGFYGNMPITFSGTSVGGLLINVSYFVLSVVSPTKFTVSIEEGGVVTVLSNDSGISYATGEAYVKFAGVTAVDEFSPAGISSSQVATGVTPTFNISYILGGYRAIITHGGTGFTLTNTIHILGSQVGGVDGTNDIQLVVNMIDAIVPNPQYSWMTPTVSNGEITAAIATGTPAETVNSYYLKVISPTQCEVYSNALMTIPVSSVDFNYVGIKSTTASSTTSGTNLITVSDTSAFLVNDPVVFTGAVFGGITVGEVYFVLAGFSSTQLRVSQFAGGAPVVLTSDSGSMFMAKSGDYTFLPEPFFFDQSLVRFNGNVYQCIVSNYDTEFIFGKWELLTSGDRRLNALDRIMGYYQPTANMPGLDLTQLVDGISYPNGIYMGNAFAPADEFEIDTILTDTPFYPVSINTVSTVWDGVNYVAVSNTPGYSAIITSDTGIVWDINKISSLGVTDITFANGRYIATTQNRVTPILASSDGITWTTSGQFTPFDSTSFDITSFDVTSLHISPTMLSSVTYFNGKFIAVGESIVTSADSYEWVETYSFGDTSLINVLYGVSRVSTSNFTGVIAVGHGQQVTYPLGGLATITDISLTMFSLDGINWTSISTPLTSLSLNSVTSGNNLIVLIGDAGINFHSVNGSNWIAGAVNSTANFQDVIYANSIFVSVGDSGAIQTSVDGSTWVSSVSTTVQNLNGITWNDTDSKFLAVGDNNTILSSTDGITWSLASVFNTYPTIYDVQGDPFLSGYGPEELVPGVVSDNLTMIITTRPGTEWDPTQYAHVGYKVTSVELTPTIGTQVDYSFDNIGITPAQLSVFAINGLTGLSTTLYPTDYTVNWVSKVVTLVSPLSFIPVVDFLRIDVYEVGNGNQLVKSNTQTDPIVSDTLTGFDEISLSCNYSATIYEGSGVIRPGSAPISVLASVTLAGDNTIACEETKEFILNSPITFQGAVFGNVATDTVYYIKTASTVTKKITVSTSLTLAGIAGPTFVLASDTGSMTVVILVGPSSTWSDPIVYHNGTKLVHGVLADVTQTSDITNSITCNSTIDMIPGTTVVFSNTMFGTTIVPQTLYYIDTIVDDNQFTISTTFGGPTLLLDTANGSALIISADYTFGISGNGITAKLMFANKYDQTVDYLTYTVFGETSPTQYGYSIPETQIIEGDNSVGPFDLTNFVGISNPLNAVVELNGLRLSIADYAIDIVSDTITLVSAITPSDKLGVTTYNLTDSQYFFTDFDITQKSVAKIANINNAMTPELAVTNVTATTAITNVLTCDDTTGFVVGQTIVFKGTLGFTNVSVDGTVYYVNSIVSPTEFTITDAIGNADITLATEVGFVVAYVGGIVAVRITTSNDHNFATDGTSLIRIDGVTGSAQLQNKTFYARYISPTVFDLYSTPYDPAFAVINYPVDAIASGSGGYAWIDATFTLSTTTATSTSALGSIVTCDSTSELIVNTPVIFVGVEFGGIVSGTTYFVKEIISSTEFIISLTYKGEDAGLIAGSGTLTVTQWEQTNVDRLWVTINGYRVPSSSLRLNADNNLSILSAILLTDAVTITSMMPSATPSELVYIQNVNNTGIPSVYRANTNSRTWLVATLHDTDTVIYVNDVIRLTNSIVQNVVAPAPILGATQIGLLADKRMISAIIVYNATTSTTINPMYYSIENIDLSPVLKITSGVTLGDLLTITTLEGNLVYIDGEQIRFTTVNLANNTLTGLTRGVNSTARRYVVQLNSEVYSVLNSNRLLDLLYDETWNSYVYSTEGDPLQISTTQAAIFLNTDINL